MSTHPLALIAEITHRCPLHCVYCSNPLEMAHSNSELSTAEWVRVVHEAAKFGVLHLHLTGGEPLARHDLVQLVHAAQHAGLYCNLITSGIGLGEDRLQALVSAGLEHLQLSFQDSREDSANWIAGAKVQAHKVALARSIRKYPLAFTVNLVVHRQNLDHLDEMIRFIEGMAPDRIEIANAQYYGWAFANRSALLPTREQVERALEVIARAETRLAGRIRIDSVVPDYYAQYPKACMGGWGRRLMLIDPAGRAMPCHAAHVIPGMEFDNVQHHSLRWLWEESLAFRRFRGEAWMPEPCRSCDRRAEDFGGCRCQAMLLTGNPNVTDPTCLKAPAHALVEDIIRTQQRDPVPIFPPLSAGSFVQLEEKSRPLWTYRPNPS